MMTEIAVLRRVWRRGRRLPLGCEKQSFTGIGARVHWGNMAKVGKVGRNREFENEIYRVGILL